jgi:ketosteroid isomerase-like protein
VEVTAGGDVAYVLSLRRIQGKMKGGKKVDYTVRVTDGFRKIDGKSRYEIRTLKPDFGQWSIEPPG